MSEPTQQVMFWSGEVRRLETQLIQARKVRNYWIVKMRKRPATLALIASVAALSLSYVDRISSP